MLDKPDLLGETITLRATRADDGAAIFSLFGDREVDRLTGTQADFTLEQVVGFYSRIVNEDDRADYLITPSGKPETILGEVVLNGIDWENRSADFRIVIFQRKDFGKGYGSQATRLMVQYGFEQLNLHRIELEVYDFNPRAAHVYEKCGFVREGVKRDVLLWDGKYQSAIVMSILQPEYKAGK